MNLLDKIKISNSIIKMGIKACPNAHIAFSGGKDSVVIYGLVKKLHPNMEAVYRCTTVDPPELLPFIKKEYPEVKIHMPEKGMFKLIEKKGLPTRLSRWCCEILKENHNSDVFVGIRSEESIKRRDRDYIQCVGNGSKTHSVINVIYDWTEIDVINYIKENNLKVPALYTWNGGKLKRIGCVGCPLASYKNRIEEFKTYPKFFNAYRKAIKKGMDANPQWKLTKLTTNDCNIAMEWWMSRLTMDEFFNKKNAEEKQYKILYHEERRK